MSSNWSYGPETAKWGHDLCDLDLWPWPFAWTSLLSLVITPENFMMIWWEKHCEKGVTDGQTEITVLRAAWSQLKTRTRWRRVKTLGQHQVGVNLQSHAQHQLWISTWHIFHEFHKIMPSLSYPVSLVNQNVILVNISHWRLHMAWIMSLMST